MLDSRGKKTVNEVDRASFSHEGLSNVREKMEQIIISDYILSFEL